VGWIVAPPPRLGKAVMCKQFSDAHTSTFAQATAAQYFASGRMKAALDRLRLTYATRATLMCGELTAKLTDAVTFAAPHGGMFVWCRLSGADGRIANSDDFAKRAIEKGVAFVPGTQFFANNPDRATFRLSFATSNEEKIREGLSRLADAL
jgi:2-aminoadipate transaminase